LEVASGSAITRLNSIETVTGSNITRLSSLEAKTGSYATTGSNTFVGGQYLSSSFNPTGFSTTASLYTDGGLRVTRDAYISGTLYLNNVTVFGTQSVAYISSSQLNIGTNLITVNTDTPSIRFGGLAVYDSGSTGLTGSLLWDSQNNHWVYSNPSGSSYSGGMFISGPRTSTLGSETGTTSCMLLAGQGGDHLTSSMIYHSSTVTCIPNTLIGSTVCSTMANASCIGIGTTSPLTKLDVIGNIRNSNAGQTVYTEIQNDGLYASGTDLYLLAPASKFMSFYAGGNERLRIASTGVSCFACQICAPTAIFTGCVGIGQTSPAFGLEVYSSRQTAITADNTFGANFNVIFNRDNTGGTRNCFNILADQNAAYLRTLDNFPMVFVTAGSDRARIAANGIACFACQVCSPIFRASNRLISNFTQIYNSDFTVSAGTSRSVVICGGILTTGDFHLMMYGNAGTGMGSIRFSTFGYFANTGLVGFCEHLRYTFGSAAISSVSNNGTSISFTIANCSGSNVISGNWRMISTVGDDANQCLNVFIL
jgi:hypothetical protein